MTKFKLFRLKNEMIFANAFANLFSVEFVHKLMFKAEPLSAEIWEIPVNEMTAGLKERERMQQSLNLAKEVQQNLLPN